MAEIVDQLRLDIAEALRDIDRVETSLNRAFEPQEIEVNTQELESTLREVERIASRAATEVGSIDLAAGRAEVNFEDLARAMGITEAEARDVTRELLEAQAAANRLEDASRDVARQLGLSDTEADRLTGSLRAADRAAEGIDRSTRGMAGGFAAVGGSLRNLALAGGAFLALRGALNFAVDAKNAFATLQDSANAVRVVFGDAVGTIEAFGQSVAQSAGLSTAEFNQSASVLGSALLNVGFGADEAATKTVELTQRAADMASIFGGPVSDALGAIQSALRGETDPIERFGVSLSEAAVNAQAAALGFRSVGGEFSTAEKAAARLDLIMQQTSRTSGDFANTAGDLANAQKIAAAEFENTKAAIGEALLPIFQSLLDMAPQLLTAIENLVPSIQAFAVSLGNVLEHREGALDLLDILQQLSDLPRAFGEVGTTLRGIGRGIFAVGEFAVGSFFDAEMAVERFNERLDESQRVLGQESLVREHTQGLIDNLRAGEDAASSFATALLRVGREGRLNPQIIKDYRQIAGTDLRETIAALQTLFNMGKQGGLTAAELREIAIALAQLESEHVSSEAERLADRFALLEESAEQRAIPALEGVRIAATEAGLGMGDLIAGVDPVAQALFDSLSDADQFALKLEAIRTGAITVADAFTSNLTPSVIDVQRGLEDLNKNGSVSMSEFITNLSTARTEFLQFMVDIAAIAEISPEVAAALQELGPEAAGELAAGFANLTPEEIRAKAEEAGLTSALSDGILGVYVEGIEQINSDDPAIRDAHIANIEAIFGEKLPGIGKILTGALQPALDASFADLEPAPLTEAILEPIRGMDAVAIAASLDEKVDYSFGLVDFPDPTDQFTEAIEDTDTQALTRAEQAVLDASFADLEPPDVDADTIAAAFAADDVLTALYLAGVEGRKAYNKGLTGSTKGDAAALRDSIVQVVNVATFRQSPPKLFLDFGKEAGETYWAGFEQADMSLRLPTPSFTGKVNTATTTPTTTQAPGGGFTFSPTYVNTETKDLETVVARSEQLMSSVAGILNGRFKL